MWLDTRETLQLSRVERDPSALAWSPDGADARVHHADAGRDTRPAREAAAAAERRAARQGRRRRRSAVVGRGWHRPDVEERSRTSSPSTPPSADSATSDLGQLQPSGARVVGATVRWSCVSGIRKPDADYLRGDSEVYADRCGLAGRDAAHRARGARFGSPLSRPTGSGSPTPASISRNFTNHVASLYLMDASGRGERLWIGGLPSSPSTSRGRATARASTTRMQERGEEQLYFAALVGRTSRGITSGHPPLSGVSIARTGQAVAIRSSVKEAGRPGGLHACRSPATGPGARRRQPRRARGPRARRSRRARGSPPPTVSRCRAG